MAEDEKFLLEYFKECMNTWRHYNSLIWQLPGITIAMIGGLLGVAFYAIPAGPPRSFVVLLAAFFAFVMYVALVKHRIFHNEITMEIHNIMEEKLDQRSPSLWNPEQMRKGPAAFRFLRWSILLLFATTLFLAILTIFGIA